MKLIALTLCVSLGALTTAGAQTPSSTDIAALLKGQQKINQRLDHLQQEIDQLKSPAATPASATPPAAAAKRLPPQYVAVKGWAVDVIPADNDTKDAVATFNWDKPELNFGLHTKLVSGTNPYTYRGTARFHPDQDGRYVFQLTLDPVKTSAIWTAFTCTGNMKINGESLLEGTASAGNVGSFDNRHLGYAPLTFSGGSKLEPSDDPKKDYVLTFQVSCFINSTDHTLLTVNEFPFWEENRFSIRVKGPDDSSGREFAGDELYHAGRLKASR